MPERSAAVLHARPLFLVHGADGFRARLRAYELVARLSHGEDPRSSDIAALPRRPAFAEGLGVTRLFAREAGPQDILMATRSDGLFTAADERRVVLVEQAEALAAASVLRDVPQEAALVLVAEVKLAPRGRAGDEGASLAEIVRELGGVVEELGPLGEGDVEDWIERRAAALGVRLDSAARTELARTVGSDLERVDRELEKLRAYAMEEMVRAEDVRLLVPGAVEAVVFDLTGAVLHKDVRTAVATLERLFELDEPPLRLLGLLVWQFRVLLVAAGARSDAELERAARQTGLSRGALLRARRIAAGVRPSLVARAYESLYAADVALKGGLSRGEQQRAVLQLLVLDLCGVEGADVRPLADVARPPPGW